MDIFLLFAFEINQMTSDLDVNAFFPVQSQYEEIYESDGFQSMSDDAIDQMLEDMSDDQTDPDPIIAVCQDVEELYLSRAKSEIHKTSLQNRADKVVIVDLEKWGFQDQTFKIHGKVNSKEVDGSPVVYSVWISDQGAKSSGTQCSCRDFYYSQFNGGKPCKHLMALAKIILPKKEE